MDDEKAVDVMARAAWETMEGADAWESLPKSSQDCIKLEVSNALAAIRAQGGEVVFWRPISDGYHPTGPDEQYVMWPKHGNTTHFATLRGPEVKP